MIDNKRGRLRSRVRRGREGKETDSKGKEEVRRSKGSLQEERDNQNVKNQNQTEEKTNIFPLQGRAIVCTSLKRSRSNPTRGRKSSNGKEQSAAALHLWTNKMTHELGHLQKKKDPSSFSNAPHITHGIHSGLLFSFDQGWQLQGFWRVFQPPLCTFLQGAGTTGLPKWATRSGERHFPFQAACVCGGGGGGEEKTCWGMGRSQGDGLVYCAIARIGTSPVSH